MLSRVRLVLWTALTCAGVFGGQLSAQPASSLVPLGPGAAGQGGAVTATALGAYALLYNPAGIGSSSGLPMSETSNAILTLEAHSPIDDSVSFRSDYRIFPWYTGVVHDGFGYLPRGWWAAGAIYGTGNSSNRIDTSFPISQETESFSTNGVASFDMEDTDSEIHVAAGLAAPLSSTIRVGFGIDLFQVTRTQRQSLVTDFIFSTAERPSEQRFIEQRGSLLESEAYGSLLSLGVQASLEHIRFGAAVSLASLFRQAGRDESQGLQAMNIDPEGRPAVVIEGFTPSVAEREVESERIKRPYGRWPSQARLGAAWLVLEDISLSADAIYTSAGGTRDKPDFVDYRHVWNYRIGLHLFESKPLSLQMGFATHHAAKPNSDQADDQAIDAHAFSTALLLRRGGWQASLAAIGLYGEDEVRVGAERTVAAKQKSLGRSLSFHLETSI